MSRAHVRHSLTSSSDRKKASRAASWLRGEARKAENRKANETRHEANLARKARGEMTPHEWQRHQRRIARDQLRAAGLLPPVGIDRVTWAKSKRAKRPGSPGSDVCMIPACGCNGEAHP